MGLELTMAITPISEQRRGQARRPARHLRPSGVKGRSGLEAAAHDTARASTAPPPIAVVLLFALADTRTSLLMREAFNRAVAAALGNLEQDAGEVRRGGTGGAATW
jgi:signal transduction histidine kinase